MRAHIDWLTFTMSPLYQDLSYDADRSQEYALALGRAFIYTFGEDLTEQVFGGEWSKQERGRAPYLDGWKLRENTISLYAHPELTHCCVEISGKGCEDLIARGLLSSVLAAVEERVTRIDIAVDMKTAVTPLEFVNASTNKRSKSNGYQTSGSGSTCYIGSQTSDRYARVYRYNKPHPRAGLLRAEHVYRRSVARQVASAIRTDGIEHVAAYSGKHFGWAHDCWKPEKSGDIDVHVSYREKDTGKSIFWLVNTIAPLFRRLVANGTIDDGEAFLRRYFLGEE